MTGPTANATTGAHAVCPECGAPVSGQGTCRENFDALLALEWEVPGGAGTLAHFYAVSSYVLQHPDAMSYTVEALAWLRSAVRSALDEGASTEYLRREAKARSASSGKVTRKEGDSVPSWGATRWSMTITDVLGGGVDGYGERVERWARLTIDDIDAADTGSGDLPSTERLL